MTPEQLAALVAALRTQRQIDMDGCEVAVSRQACDEAADAIEHLQAEVARLSTPPDDAEVLAIIKDVTFEAVNSEIDRVLAGRICQKLARLSHALAKHGSK